MLFQRSKNDVNKFPKVEREFQKLNGSAQKGCDVHFSTSLCEILPVNSIIVNKIKPILRNLKESLKTQASAGLSVFCSALT